MTGWNITYRFVREIGTFRLNLELYATQHRLRSDFSFYYCFYQELLLLLIFVSPPLTLVSIPFLQTSLYIFKCTSLLKIDIRSASVSYGSFFCFFLFAYLLHIILTLLTVFPLPPISVLQEW